MKSINVFFIIFFTISLLLNYNVRADLIETIQDDITLDKHQYAMWTIQNVEGGYITMEFYDAYMEDNELHDFVYVILFNSWEQYQKYLDTGEIECYWVHGGYQYSGYGKPVYLPETQPMTYYLVIDNTWGIWVSLDEAINDLEGEDDGREFPDEPVSFHHEESHDNQRVSYEFVFNLKGDSVRLPTPVIYNHKLSASLYYEHQQEKENDENQQSNDNDSPSANTPGFEVYLLLCGVLIILKMKKQRRKR